MLPVRVLFLGGLHNQGPASRSLLLLADCCLQPNPTAWRNVKYSLLNCRAGVGLEPYQAFTAEEYYTPNFKHGKTKSTSQSRIRRAFCHIPATHPSRNSYAPESFFINPLRLSSLSLWGKTFTWALFALKGNYRLEKANSDSSWMPSDICKIFIYLFIYFFLFAAPILYWQRSLLLGLAGLLSEPAGSAVQASPPLLQLPARSQGARLPAYHCLTEYTAEHLLAKDAGGKIRSRDRSHACKCSF